MSEVPGLRFEKVAGKPVRYVAKRLTRGTEFIRNVRRDKRMTLSKSRYETSEPRPSRKARPRTARGTDGANNVPSVVCNCMSGEKPANADMNLVIIEALMHLRRPNS